MYSSAKQNQEEFLKWGYDEFHPYPFRFIINYHPITGRSIVRVTDSIVK